MTVWYEMNARHVAAHRLVSKCGETINPGDKVTSLGDEEFTFKYISRAPGDGSATNGKVVVADADGHEYELYPAVFDATVQRIPGATSPFDVYTGETTTNERGQRGHWSLAGTWVPEA